MINMLIGGLLVVLTLLLVFFGFVLGVHVAKNEDE